MNGQGDTKCNVKKGERLHKFLNPFIQKFEFCFNLSAVLECFSLITELKHRRCHAMDGNQGRQPEGACFCFLMHS